MQTEELFHVPGKYKVGDRVKVVRDIKQAKAWYYNHNSWHEVLVGEQLYVRQADPFVGYALSRKRNDQMLSYFPSCALELVPAVTEANIDVPAAPATTQSQSAPVAVPAKRVRVKAAKTQPWDEAPCTHLRWHLMGLLKEKLKMQVTAVYENGILRRLPPGAKGLAMVTTCCVKCGTKMNMSVPLEG